MRFIALRNAYIPCILLGYKNCYVVSQNIMPIFIIKFSSGFKIKIYIYLRSSFVTHNLHDLPSEDDLDKIENSLKETVFTFHRNR